MKMLANLTMKKFASLIASTGAAVALGAFAFSEYQNRPGAALGAAAFCLSLLFIATQEIEAFEGLGIKAKLRYTLNVAEQRIQYIDGMLYTLASATFFQIARGSLTTSERKSLSDELTNSLLQSGMASDKISSLKGPIYSYIAQCFWYSFGSLRASYISFHANVAQKEMLSISPGPDRDSAERKYNYFMQSKVSEYPDIHNFARFRDLIIGLVNVTPLAQDGDKEKLLKIANEFADAFDSCIFEGGFTIESIRMIDDSERMDTPYMRGLRSRLD